VVLQGIAAAMAKMVELGQVKVPEGNFHSKAHLSGGLFFVTFF
jgi:hypothetical protein